MTEPVVPYPSLEGAECPYPFYELARRRQPVVPVPGRPNMYLVARYDDVRHVLATPDVFSSRDTRVELASTGAHGKNYPILGGDVAVKPMVDVDGPDHLTQRELALMPLRPKQLQSYAALIDETVMTLIDAWASDGRCEFISSFAAPLPLKVTCRLLGLPEEIEPSVAEWGRLESVGLSWMPDEFRDAQRTKGQEMYAYLTDAILERSRRPTDDVIGEVIREQVARDGEFRLDLVRAVVVLLVAGGVGTAAHSLGSTMLLLAQNPDEQRILREDPALVPRLVEEALRLEAPAQWIARRVEVDTTLAGVALPAGAILVASIGSGNRDEARFESAQLLDPARRNASEHLAFGFGRHFCVGAPLARLVSRIAFERLLERLDDIRLAPAADLSHVESPTFRGLRRLDIEFDAR